MLNRIARAAAMLFVMNFTVGAYAQEAPDALVKKTVGEVLDVMKQTREQRKLTEVAETKVLPYFDFRQMTQLAVGRSWSQATAAQREALEREFRTLLVRTYTTALSTAGADIKVDVKPARMDGDEALVRTAASERGQKPVQIDYKMAKGSGSWKVYDVIVENLSLVTSYRGSFQSEITRSGIDGLIKVLETKNKTAQG